MCILCLNNEPEITGCKVLVIGGDPDSAGELRIILNRWGNSVQPTLGTLEAIAKASLFMPELMLLNLSLP